LVCAGAVEEYGLTAVADRTELVEGRWEVWEWIGVAGRPEAMSAGREEGRDE